jgi:CheY-like chemotaxis protein
MNAYDVLVIGSEGSRRADLEERLRRLGHSVVVADLDEGRDLAPGDLYDVVVVDAREPESDWRPLSAAASADLQPVLLVADQPRRLIAALSGRSAGVMVLTGAESDSGYQVALSVCAAFRRARHAHAGPLVA